MNTRPTMAGPDTTVPGAQMIGRKIALSFALRPFAPSESDDILREAMLFRAIPCHGQLSVNAPPWSGSAAKPVISCDNPALLISAFKVSQDRKNLVLRLFNPTQQNQSANLKISKVRRIQPCLLTERTQEGAEALDAERGRFAIEIPPLSLRTFLISFKKPRRRYDYEYGLLV